jgi:ABC-2 type transport system permease protein
MSRARSVAEVARWEFLRYVKPKQQVLSLILTFAFLMGGTYIGRLAGGPSEVELAVMGAEHLPTLPERAGRFRMAHSSSQHESRLRQEVEDRKLDGLLLLLPGGQGQLYARQDPAWRADLERELLAASVMHRLGESAVSPQELAALNAPFSLDVMEVAPRAGRGERIAAIVALSLVLLGLFTGIGYIFASVTGEKQNRLSEQVVSAIPAQTWIDGKILGLSAVSMVAVLNTVAAGLLYLAASRVVWGTIIHLPTTVERAELLAVALFLILLGYLFWFAFLTAVAALMEDPHTSTRNQFLFLPILSTVPAFIALSDPTAAWVRALGLLPPTSAAVMPARLLITEVPWWEVGLASVLLVALGLVVRRGAGKVFRLGMLMYGKEPSWAEVRRWLREA